MQRPSSVDRTLVCIPLFGDSGFHLARFELDLAVSVVSKTITDIDRCTSTDVALQYNVRLRMR